MSNRLDCLVVGYHDPAFSRHEQRVMSRGPDFPDRRIFNRDHLYLDGRRLPYMDVINHCLDSAGGAGPVNYYHVGEVANLAAVYLTSYLATRGYSAQFAGLFAPERARIAQILDREDPRVVAVTTTFYLVPAPAAEIVRYVRAGNPESTIVLGGPLVDNLATDLDAESLSEVFDWIGADVYVRESQGEATLRQVIDAVRAGHPLSGVPNLFVRDGDRFGFTGRQPEANSLDECAIDWDLFSDTELGATVQTRTARSCAFKCSFCDFPSRAGALTLASIETVEGELRKLARRGVKNLVFIDDTFNVPLHRFKDLCRMMIRNDFGFRWYSFFRCSSARDDETFDLAAASGCAAVFLGIEAASDSVLKLMHKSATVAQYRHGIQQLHARGITTFASFVTGFPGETAQTVGATIDFLNSAQPTYFRCEPWWYNHRSPIHQRAAELGITGSGYAWRHQTMDIGDACDAIDRIFGEVTGSRWIPTYNFDFWALPYLYGKGLTPEQAVQFHERAQRVMAYNTDPDAPGAAQAVAHLKELFAGIQLTPARYRPPVEVPA